MNKNVLTTVDNLVSTNYILNEEGGFQMPSDTYVISQNSNGTVLSLFGDDVFDLTPYRTTKKISQKIYFKKFPKLYIEQAKHLFIILYTLSDGRGATGLAVGTIYGKMINLIKPLCVFAEEKKISVYEILNTPEHLNLFIKDRALSTIIALSDLLNLLEQKGKLHTGIEVNYPEKLKSHIRTLIKNKDPIKQTPVIPSGIYIAFLQNSWAVVEDFEKNSQNLFNFGTAIMETKTYATADKKYSIHIRENPDLKKYPRVTWKEAVSEHGLMDLFVKYKVSNKTTWSTYVSKIQGTCKLLIHAYSGMRDNEVLSLRWNCLDTDPRRPSVRLIGETSKFTGRNKTVKWVTTKDIDRVINVLRTIVKILSINHIADPEKENLLLFIGAPPILDPVDQEHFRKVCSMSKSFCLDDPDLKITEEHIAELERIDYSRDWRNDKYFEIGKNWPFATHQFRRSLAIYAAQSGLVTISSLMKQLKHLWHEMTFYYQNGCSEAKSLFKINKAHMGNVYNETKPEADALAYIHDILLSDEPLYGALGKHIQPQHKDKDESRLIILQSKVETMKKFKNGEIAYTETALGGCGEIGTCSKRLTGSLSACIGCEKAQIKISKLDKTIDLLDRFVSKLNKNSVEYRTDLAELNRLRAFKEAVA